MLSDDIGELRSHNGRRGIPSLLALRCFEAAAREESFTRAADALSLTHGAVSRAVRLLEDDIGVELFERRNRRVFLTQHGRKLADAVAHGFKLIEVACNELRELANGSSLTLACEPTLLMRWLIPNLAALQRAQPNLKLQLVAASGPALGQGADMAIRRNDIEWPEETEATMLFNERIGPVCRRESAHHYIGNHNGLPCIKNSAPLLHTKTRPDAWKTWSALTKTNLPNRNEKVFEHFYFSLQAATAGLGVAVGPWHLVRDDIENGLLDAPLGFVEDGSAYFLVSSRPTASSPSRAAVRDWLLRLAGKNPSRPHREA
ncbi:LysR family transcriptional regulator (plasmid) [Ralstonia sp. 25C]|uniref:LysR family transcriptional regulator n=1 Tax=Ralstonia sp. 25C TaxID=3447363 RepID=UPI003F74FCE3